MEKDRNELLSKLERTLRGAPDEVKFAWLAPYFEAFVDDSEEVPPLDDLIDAWVENQGQIVEGAEKEFQEMQAQLEEDVWRFRVTKEELFIEIDLLRKENEPTFEERLNTVIDNALEIGETCKMTLAMMKLALGKIEKLTLRVNDLEKKIRATDDS